MDPAVSPATSPVVTLAGASTFPFAPVAPAKRRLLQRAACDGRRLGLALHHVDGLAEAMRELGAGWSPHRRMWVCELAAGKQLLQGLLDQARRWPAFTLEDLREAALAAWRHPTPDYFVELLDVQVLPLARGGLAVSSEYDPLVVKAVKGLGGRFHRHARAWEVKAHVADLLQALEQVAGVGEAFVFQHDAQGVLEDLVAPSKSELPISVPGAAPMAGQASPAQGAGDGLGSGFLSTLGTPLQAIRIDEKTLGEAAKLCGLRDYQVVGVRHLIGHSSALLADDMGLGKTRQAVVASRLAAGDAQVLVSCPSSLTINWAREILAVYPQAHIAMIGQHDAAAVAQADWIIANYERLGGLVKARNLRIEVLVIDEAHYLKEHEAGRTRNAFLLAERVPRRFLLTGTPVLNREVELHTLLRLSGHPIGMMPLADFRKQYAGDRGRRDELASQLSQWMLRRGKDVLKDLGEKTQQLRYVKAADDLAGYKALMADSTLQAMPKITKLRQHLESLKFEFLIESIQCLPQDAKALVFCEYVETVESLRQVLASEGIQAVTLVGSDAPKKRMAAVDAFQGDPNVKVFIGTTQAAGVGITLTAANYVFFASLPWTPALKRQAEDRAYRSGQKRDVFVIVPVVAETIDEQIFALLDSKREIELALVEANRTAVGAA